MEGVADSLVLPVAGLIIVGLLSLIGFGIKKMLTGIYTSIDSIKKDLTDMNIESKLLRAEITDIYKTTDIRFSNIENKVSRLEDKQATMRDDISGLKEDIKTIRRQHFKHHPDDNIEIK